MEFYQPDSLDEALALLQDAGRALTPVAGGTDVMVSWHQREKSDLALLDLSRVPDLDGARLTDEHLELGALATYWDVLASRELCTAYPLMAQAARQVGAIQIQTRGTWAGNIANGSPAADGVPVLLAYDATVVLSARGSNRAVKLDEYFTGYKQSVRRADELITAIRIPRRTRRHEWFCKVGARRAQAISKVGVAMVCDDQGWRVAVNSVAPTVCRCRALEQALEAGQALESPAEVRDILSADIAPISDLRSTAEYRANVLARLVYYWLQEHRPQAGQP